MHFSVNMCESFGCTINVSICCRLADQFDEINIQSTPGMLSFAIFCNVYAVKCYFCHASTRNTAHNVILFDRSGRGVVLVF